MVGLEEVRAPDRGELGSEHGAHKLGMQASHFNGVQFFWLMLAASLVAMVAQRLRVPYALALVVTGLLIGAPHLLPSAHLDPELLFTFLLPPLLFEAAIQIRTEHLRREWRLISLYALGGTLVAASIVGGLGWAFLGFSLPVALLFGTLISPTDPISVIAVFKRLGVGKRLSLLVEAESLFNDGVAVVVFQVVLAYAVSGVFSLTASLVTFVAVVVGGAGVGAAIGALASRLTRHFNDHLLEITLTTIVAFGSYLCAEALHVSGVIAVVAAGLVVGNYGVQTGMSATTRLAVSSFWEYLAFAANSVVFLLLGIEVTLVNFWGSLGAVLGAAAVVLAARAVAVYLLSFLGNAAGERIPGAWQHVLVWAGLRGALSMALVLGLPQTLPGRDHLVVLTFGVVLFSLLLQGLSLGPLLNRLGLSGERTATTELGRLVSEGRAVRAAMAELARMREEGFLPRTVYAGLFEEYTQRREALERGVENLSSTVPDLARQQSEQARLRALQTEKSALREMTIQGVLDEEDFRVLVERIDEDMLGLRTRDDKGAYAEGLPET